MTYGVISVALPLRNRPQGLQNVVKKREHGFTLIELLVVVAIIGILASIAIPNLLTAIQRAKQKRTMVDMRNLASAWEARNIEANRYNAAGVGIPGIEQAVLLTDLEASLSPTYIKTMPRFDGWGFPIGAYTSDGWGAPTGASAYALVSPGKDGTVSSSITMGATTSFDCDIVYSNGAFLAYPDGSAGR